MQSSIIHTINSIANQCDWLGLHRSDLLNDWSQDGTEYKDLFFKKKRKKKWLGSEIIEDLCFSIIQMMNSLTAPKHADTQSPYCEK
jgi:hypothetical protein